MIKTPKILCGKFPWFCDVKILNMSYGKKIPFSGNRSCVVSLGWVHRDPTTNNSELLGSCKPVQQHGL